MNEIEELLMGNLSKVDGLIKTESKNCHSKRHLDWFRWLWVDASFKVGTAHVETLYG